MPAWTSIGGVTCNAGWGNRIMGTDSLEKVLDRLAVTEKSTIVLERAPDGKIRVTSGSWDAEKVILKD
jgi:hypothetical protein